MDATSIAAILCPGRFDVVSETMKQLVAKLLMLVVAVGSAGDCSRSSNRTQAAWEVDNPLVPIPTAPLGLSIDFQKLDNPPTPARVRLGRWFFFDTRLSADGTVSCATCHQPEFAFSQGTRVATGVNGRTGTRKVLPIINLVAQAALTNFRTRPQAAFFWDGRAMSLERQALQPVASHVEMGSSESAMIRTISAVAGYRRYFAEAFGDEQITKERVAQALADYERTRLSGNSPFDQWRVGRRDTAVSDAVKRGYALFTGKAQCAHCHGSLNGGGFHNTGIGWDAHAQRRADEGRYAVTKGTVFEEWPGTFKVPTLREVSRHPPYMHDGSIRTLREVVEFYNRGAIPNPDLSAFIHPLGLDSQEIDALVAFLNSLNGDGWQDAGPLRFPE
jgi:cytochrome c peroxidase